ncbi:hypothetical protein LZ30DRAFT_75313 [Colletotrichum cereale]|nr:hypothetical protein LZ30DRAFT_75313 [Colletotrichum cereale]
MPSNPQPRPDRAPHAQKHVHDRLPYFMRLFPGFVLRPPLRLHLHLASSNPLPFVLTNCNSLVQHIVFDIRRQQPGSPTDHSRRLRLKYTGPPVTVQKLRCSFARHPILHIQRRPPVLLVPVERVSTRSSLTDRTLNSAHVHGWPTASRIHPLFP